MLRVQAGKREMISKGDDNKCGEGVVVPTMPPINEMTLNLNAEDKRKDRE